MLQKITDKNKEEMEKCQDKINTLQLDCINF